MEPVSHKLAIETQKIGWSQEVEQLENDELRAFSGIFLAVGAGLAIWALVYLFLQLF